MVTMNPTSCNGNDLKSFKMENKSTVLDGFAKIIAKSENVRLDGGVILLKNLTKQRENADSKELDYSLRRLIRGLGSSRVISKKGFYATLTAYLKVTSDINIDDILQIMESQLKATNGNSKSENADVHMGRILLCGALIRSKFLCDCTIEEQQKIIEIILTAGTKRSYLSFLSYSFLIEYINQVDEKTLKASVWPIIAKELGRSWEDQSLDSFYALIIMNTKFPSLVDKKFLKQHLNTETIIDRESMDKLLKLLTDTPRRICCHHPLYKVFCEKLTSTEYVIEFWTGIDQRFIKPSKTIEYLGLEILSLILSNIRDQTLIPSLLSPNFLKHMLRRFTNSKQCRNDDIANAFKKILTQLISILAAKDTKAKIQIAVLKKLILYPGDLMIEKITNTKVIQMITTNMGTSGVKKLSKFYWEIALNSELENKTESWTNAQRTYAGQLLSKLLGHHAMNSEHAWRLDQLKFLFNLGHCEVSNVSVELALQFKESFYRTLDHKLPKLTDLYNVLNELIHHLNKIIFSSNKSNTLRAPLDKSAVEAWTRMIDFIKKLDNDSDNKQAVLIFYIMDLSMGLQLFSDPEMAISAINEIHNCFEHFMKEKSTKKNKKIKVKGEDETEEPEWVEVIVDLLLSLLSKNSHLLRSLVRCVFPHLCPVLTATTIHQILAVLVPKDDKEPLVPINSTDDDASDLTSDSESENNEDNVNSDNSSDEISSDSDNDEDEIEDESTSSRFRLAVQQALGRASAQTDDEDMDVDQINEEEGKRLDESLAAAFRNRRENRQSNKKKQEKPAEALTHFRVRVIDLLEIYLEFGPSMALALDILVPLLALLEFCIKDPHQKPLENRVRKCLKKLSTLKKFKDCQGVDEKLVTDLARILIEKGERSTSVCQEMSDKLSECCIFLIRCVQQAGLPSSVLVQLYCENLTAFFKKRDCVLPACLFRNILQLNWNGNWELTPLLIEYAFDKTIRSFRRGQALEFLTVFYRNHRMIKNEKHTSLLKKMEEKLSMNTINLLREIVTERKITTNESSVTQNGNVGTEVRQKFIGLLWTLLHAIYPIHLSKVWDWKAIGDAMAEYRKKVSLCKVTKTAYNRLASQIGAPKVITPQVKITEQLSVNGEQNDDKCMKEETEKSTDEETENGATQIENSKNMKKKMKKRSKQKDKHKLKKKSHDLRMKAMTEGLDSIDFSSIFLHNGNSEYKLAEDTNLDESTTPSPVNNVTRKREPVDSLDPPVKSKKKKKQSTELIF